MFNLSTLLRAALLLGCALTGRAQTELVSLHRSPVKLLMIGDSLTVGDFGAVFESHLTHLYGRNGFVLLGSCGSSPENWLQSEPVFTTKCGFRRATPALDIVYDFDHGRPPPGIPTPKIEGLLREYQPMIVIVQLGTNWMDPIVAHGPDDAKYGGILERFIAALHAGPNAPRQIIWITPPDASKYSPKVKSYVDELINKAARGHGVGIIDSARLTHYVPGVSGSDGVHYHTKEAAEWAEKVIARMHR